MKHISTFFAILGLWIAFLVPSQAQLTVTISDVTDAHVCGTSLVNILFSNTGTKAIKFQSISLDLDPGPTDYVALQEGLDYPGFTLLSAPPLTNPQFALNGTLAAGESRTLTMEALFSCEYFNHPELLLLPHDFALTYTYGLVPAPGQPIFWQTDDNSISFPIRHTDITPAVNLPVLSTEYDVPFNITIPLNISGDQCDKDFIVSLDEDISCLDYSQAKYAIMVGNNTYDAGLIQPLAGPEFRFAVKTSDVGLQDFCDQFYPGGMGEIKLIIKDLKIACGCGTPGTFYPINIGFTPCNPDEAPASCLDANGNLVPQNVVEQQITIQRPPQGALTITEVGGNTFSICSGSNVMHLKISNNSGKPVYNIDLDFFNAMGYNIQSVLLNGNPVPLTPAPSVHLDFSANIFGGYGLQTLNGDHIFEELAPGSFIFADVTFSPTIFPHCGIGNGSACSNNCETTTLVGAVLSAKATWNDICGTNVEPLSTTLKYEATINSYYALCKYDATPLTFFQPRVVTLEMTGALVQGFTGYLNQGPMHRYICIQSNLGSDKVDFGNVFINGNPIPIDDNGFADLGVSTVPLATIITFNFQLIDCDPGEKELDFTISHGVFFEGCSSCYIPLACQNAKFVTPCADNGSGCQIPGAGNACGAFSSVNLKVYNSVYPVDAASYPALLNVYPCDEIKIKIDATVGPAGVDGHQLVFGFAVDAAMIDYFTLQGHDLKVLFPGGADEDIDLLTLKSIAIPNSPISIIYFETDGEYYLEPGDKLWGYLTLKAKSSFGDFHNKVDFFAPVVGYSDANGPKFCSDGFDNVYALDVDYAFIDDISYTCGDAGLYNGYLIKLGGEIFFPDFPGKSRFAAKFYGLVYVTVGTLDDDYHVLVNCVPQANDSYPVTVVDQPTGYEPHGAILQTFSFKFEENCEADLPVTIKYEVHKVPDSKAPCNLNIESETVTRQVKEPVIPSVATRFDPTIGTFEYVSDNLFNLNIQTTYHGDAKDAWIQLEYDPTRIEIDPSQVTGPIYGAAFLEECHHPNSTNKVLVIPITAPVDPGADLLHTIKVKFLQASCSGNTGIRLYGFHHCGCTQVSDFMCASDYPTYDKTVCEDSYQELGFKFLDSDLLVSKTSCPTPGANCNRYKAVISINNPGQGNTSNVNLKAILPPGITILSATYRPNGMAGSCDVGSVAVNINELLNGGWTIPAVSPTLPAGKLYGLQSTEPNPINKGNLVLLFKLNGPSAANDDVTIIANGTKPCGQPLQSTIVLPNLSVDAPTGTMTFATKYCIAPPTTSPTPVTVTINVTPAPVFPPGAPHVLHYNGGNIYCDANNNGIPEPGVDPVILGNFSSMATGFVLNATANPNVFSNTWNIPSAAWNNWRGCSGNQAILTFGVLYVLGGSEVEYCTPPAFGNTCTNGQKPGERDNTVNEIVGSTFTSSVQPNPFSSDMEVGIMAPNAEKADITVFNQLGATVYTNSYQLTPGESTSANLDLENLTPGIYFLRVTANAESQYHKIIKQ